MVSRWRPGLDRTIAAALWVAVALMASALLLRTPADLDTGWNLRTGQETWRRGELLRADPFLFSTDQPLPPALDSLAPAVDAQRLDYPLRSHWLGQIAMYGLWCAAGDAGLRLFVATLWLLLLLALGLIAHRLELTPAWRPLLLIAVIDGLALYLVTRPALFSFVGIAGSLPLWIALQRRRQLRWGWLAVALLPLWAQLHGGFLYGIALAEIWIAGTLIDGWWPHRAAQEQRLARHQLALLGLAAVVLPLLLNPTGPISLLTSVAGALSLGRDYLPSEYQTPDLWWSRLFWIYGAVALALAPAAVRRSSTAAGLLLVGGVVLGALARRNVPLFMLAALPFVLATGQALLLDPAARPGSTPSAGTLRPALARWLPALLGAMLAADFYLATPDIGRRPGPPWPSSLPMAIAEFVRSDPPPGHPYNNANQGGFLLWQVPQIRWFTDGRTLVPRLDAYQYNWGRTVEVAGEPRPVWRVLFDHYRIDWAVIFGFEQTDHGLRLAPALLSLLHEPDWLPVAAGNGSLLFVRQSPTTADYLARHRPAVADLQAMLLHLLAGGGTAALLDDPAVWLDLTDLLLAAGRIGPLGPAELPAPEQLLLRIDRSRPQYAEAQRRLARWPDAALPFLDRLAPLAGGEPYARLAASVRARAAASRPGN